MDKETAINKASAIVNDYINTHKAEDYENFTEFTAWLTDHYDWAECVYGFEFLYETMVATPCHALPRHVDPCRSLVIIFPWHCVYYVLIRSLLPYSTITRSPYLTTSFHSRVGESTNHEISQFPTICNLFKNIHKIYWQIITLWYYWCIN